MAVYLISEAEKDKLIGKKWKGNKVFYPTQDEDDNWFISGEEMDGFLEGVKDKSLLFLVNAVEIPHNPKQNGLEVANNAKNK